MDTNDILKYVKNSVKIFSEPPKNLFEFMFNKLLGIGGALFHYTSCNHLESNLDKGLTYFNEPKNFNDPFDCNFDGDLYKITSNILKKFLIESPHTKDIIDLFKNGQYEYIKPLLAKQPNFNVKLFDWIKNLYDGKTVDINDLLKINGSEGFDFPKMGDEVQVSFEKVNKIINQTFRIACFATTNSNGLLWSHYADKHKGYCIEYDITKFDFKFLLLLYPVIYSKNRFIMPLENYYDYTKKTIIDKFYDNHSFLENIVEGLLTKSEIWSYENEWRIVLLKEQEHLFRLPIKGVYLGAKISDEHKNKIYEYANKHGFFVKEFNLDKNEYKLNMKE